MEGCKVEEDMSIEAAVEDLVGEIVVEVDEVVDVRSMSSLLEELLNMMCLRGVYDVLWETRLKW